MSSMDAAARSIVTRAEQAVHAGVDLTDDWHALLLDRRLGKAGPFQNVIDQQLRFRIVGDGPFLERLVVADSPIAHTVIGRPEVQKAIRGAMATIDAAKGAKQLEGITFSYDEAGFIANRAVQAMVGTAATVDNFQQAVGTATTHVLGFHAVRAGNWIHMGPEKSRPFVEFFRGSTTPETREGLGRSIKTLLHEIAHIVTPRGKDEKHLRWLSEGVAETWARWPGNINAAAKRMGAPALADFHKVIDAENEKYPDQAKVLRTLLQLAGVDTNDPKQLATFEELCQTVGVSDIPMILARRIDERFPGISRTEVHKLIMSLSPNETDVVVAPVEDLAKRARQQIVLPRTNSDVQLP
ncbi:MAG: hypothetical protein JWL76_548 [Thermoleophilia bacterium]|nr:hypothetical protein [Thermoleophilia bacterium]